MAERQLPKLNVAGSIPVSRSNLFSKLATHPKSCAPFVLRSHDSQTTFQPIHGDLPTLNRRPRIHVLVHVQTVAQLISDELSLNP